MIVAGLLIASALMARVSHPVALPGFSLSGLIGLYMIWRIVRSPGEFRKILPRRRLGLLKALQPL